MVKKPAFPGGDTAFFNLTPEPFIVIKGFREQLQRDLIDRTSRLRSKAVQLGFEFRRNLQFHEISVGSRPG